MDNFAQKFLTLFADFSDTTTLLGLAQLAVLIVSAGLVVAQLRKNTAEVTKTHDWNRRKSSQEACYEFMRPSIQADWSAIYAPLIVQRKTHADLTPEQLESLRRVIYFLENLGILMKHNIVEEDIIFDFFGSVWPALHNQVGEFVRETQVTRGSDTVFETFVHYARGFAKRHEARHEQRKAVGSVPPKPRISG